jgi:hypothetical protein
VERVSRNPRALVERLQALILVIGLRAIVMLGALLWAV